MLSATRFSAVRARLDAFEPRPGWHTAVYEFLLFGFKQGWACLFGGLMLCTLFLTRLYWPEHAALSRYDGLTLIALAVQLGMLAARLESWEEARIILAFHLVGTAMEVFKTAHGSWAYPEPAVLRIGGVPLFSGFMYASVGSYLARVWRIFDFRFTRYPSVYASRCLAGAFYVNFFAHHWMIDLRWPLLAICCGLFARTRVYFRMWRVHRWMPLLLGFFLVALFIWFGENIGTFSHAWIYPSQQHGWALVSPQKLISWFMLMYISFVLVESLHGATPSPPAQ